MPPIAGTVLVLVLAAVGALIQAGPLAAPEVLALRRSK
jgi:hypothetical protein